MNWEYHSQSFSTEFRFLAGTQFCTTSMDKQLNQLGSQGWELVSVFDINKLKGGSKSVVAVFKRPLANESA